MLLRHLPPESATKTALRESMTPEEADALPSSDGHGPWSTAELLLAAVVDALGVLAWQQSQIHGGSKNPPPEPLRRPGTTPRKSTTAISPAARAYLQRLRDTRGQDPTP